MKYSLVIPCYNEKDNIPLLLEKCRQLSDTDQFEIILVDNGSTDGSAQVIKDLLPNYKQCVCVTVVKNQGYGYGILQGLKSATGNVIGWTHADLQTDPLDLLKAVAFFETHGADIFVKGRRFGRPVFDQFFTIGMSFFETIILRKPMWDINAQPTLFSRKFLQECTNPPSDFSLDLYMYYMAKRLNKKVFRFPVYFGERLHGASKWNLDWKSKIKFIKRTVDFSFKLMFSLAK